MTMINNKKGFGNIWFITLLGFIYFVLLYWSNVGWGYIGYRKYHQGPVAFYRVFGSVNYGYTNHKKSTKGGSIGKRSYRGGGLRGGK